MRSTLKNTLRLMVSVIAAQALEVDGASNHRLGNCIRHLRLRLLTDVQHHGADQIFKQRDLLGLESAGTEKGFWRFHEVNFFRIVNVLAQRG
ncbi:hypothetical protein D3C87_1940490 [compost metagenome]